MDSGLISFEAARSQLAVLQEQVEGLELRIEESQLSYDSTEQDIQGQLLNCSQNCQELATQQKIFETILHDWMIDFQFSMRKFWTLVMCLRKVKAR